MGLLMPSRQVPGSVPAAAERFASKIRDLQTRVANAPFDPACLGNFPSGTHAYVKSLPSNSSGQPVPAPGAQNLLKFHVRHAPPPTVTQDAAAAGAALSSHW